MMSLVCVVCVYIYIHYFSTYFVNGNLFSLLSYNLLCIAFKWKIVKYFVTIINCTTSFNIYCGSYTTLTLEKCNVHIIFTTNFKWYVIGPRLESNIVRKLTTKRGGVWLRFKRGQMGLWPGRSVFSPKAALIKRGLRLWS